MSSGVTPRISTDALLRLRSWEGRTEVLSSEITQSPIDALSATLDRDDAPATRGGELPLLWHWLYFLPHARQFDLGQDGHPRLGGFLPPIPLPRRMWAGGRLKWHAPLQIGDSVELVQRLQRAGVKNIEVTSFVSPAWVPQMADNAEVMAGIRRDPGVRYSVLTPNMKGFERAVASRADDIVVFGAASEAFSQRNINCSIAESIARFAPVVAAARERDIGVRGAISMAVGCPYEGEVPRSGSNSWPV